MNYLLVIIPIITLIIIIIVYEMHKTSTATAATVPPANNNAPTNNTPTNNAPIITDPINNIQTQQTQQAGTPIIDTSSNDVAVPVTPAVPVPSSIDPSILYHFLPMKQTPYTVLTTSGGIIYMYNGTTWSPFINTFSGQGHITCLKYDYYHKCIIVCINGATYQVDLQGNKKLLAPADGNWYAIDMCAGPASTTNSQYYGFARVSGQYQGLAWISNGGLVIHNQSWISQSVTWQRIPSSDFDKYGNLWSVYNSTGTTVTGGATISLLITFPSTALTNGITYVNGTSTNYNLTPSSTTIAQMKSFNASNVLFNESGSLEIWMYSVQLTNLQGFDQTNLASISVNKVDNSISLMSNTGVLYTSGPNVDIMHLTSSSVLQFSIVSEITPPIESSPPTSAYDWYCKPFAMF